MILLLFTSTYPYDAGAEQTFLSLELTHLKKAFERVILVPRMCNGKRLALADGIEVDESLARGLSRDRLAALRGAFFSPILYRDILSRPSILLHPEAFKRLVKFTEIAELTRQWTGNWLERAGVPARECLFYTYWFDDISMGIGLAKDRHPELCLVSRAHNYDVYEERYAFRYWPCRRASLALLDRLYTDSEAGRQYIAKRYPQFESKYCTALLGTGPAGFTNRPSHDGAFRIVSCSNLVPVKRVELILDGIACAARRKPEARFEWVHIGDGKTRGALQERVKGTFPANASGSLPGHYAPEDLFAFYKTHAVDVFINASSFEGTPVSIMEVTSYGIPVIATAVGGNREIVSVKNGTLLPADPTAEEIAAAIVELQADPGSAAQKRIEARHTWRDKYNAGSNYSAFAESLLQVRSRRQA